MLDQLAQQSWSQNEPRDLLRRSIESVHAYGLYAPDGSPAGFLSVLSDGVYNARLSNLFVIPAHRGQGVGRWMMSTLLNESQLCNVRNWQLITDDMHPLYRRFGFRLAEKSDVFMTLAKPRD